MTSFNKEQQAEFLNALVMEMPFGKYQGRKLMDLPGHYLAWFNRQGFPPGILGKRMALVFELDHNGLLSPLRSKLK